MRQTGVYIILNLLNGRAYVGSSVHVPQRWREHLSALNLGKHANIALQSDWNQHGSRAFSWSQVEKSETRNDAIRAEQRHIDAHANLYNAARRAGSGPRDGFKHTPESRAKMSATKKGRPKSAEHRQKLGDSRRGVPNPAHGDRLRGRKHAPEHCAAIARGNTGKTHTDEHKNYMRQLMTGRNVTWGASISAGKRGKPWSQARRASFDAKTE